MQIIAPVSAGSAVDIISRIYAERLSKRLGQQFLVINRQGAGGTIAAAAVANSLRARRLIFMSDVPGLLADPKDPASLIATLKVGEVDELKRKGVVAGGMIPKVDSAVKALKEGVRRVHFIDGRVPHALLLEVFTESGLGTMVKRSAAR